jgi:hypothetical protein
MNFDQILVERDRREQTIRDSVTMTPMSRHMRRGWKVGLARKRLRDRRTGVGWQNLRRKRWLLTKVRLMRKKMSEERSASARGQFLRAAFENMVGGATKHTSAKTHRVTALEVSDWISRKVRGRGRSSRLVALHGLCRWRHKRMGEGRDVIGMLRGSRESSRGKAGSISRRDRGSD